MAFRHRITLRKTLRKCLKFCVQTHKHAQTESRARGLQIAENRHQIDTENEKVRRIHLWCRRGAVSEREFEERSTSWTSVGGLERRAKPPLLGNWGNVGGATCPPTCLGDIFSYSIYGCRPLFTKQLETGSLTIRRRVRCSISGPGPCTQIRGATQRFHKQMRFESDLASISN